MERYLTFDKHINETNKKATGILMFINRIQNFFDKKDTHNNSTISCVEHFKLLYCDMAHYKHNSTDKCTKKLQNFAAKIADGKARKYDHVHLFYIKYNGFL